MISTIPLRPGVTALLRESFTPLLDGSGNHRHDKDGQPYFAADVYVAGALGSPFARAGEAKPGQIRLRTIGDPQVAAGNVVRLDGDVRLSTWSQRSRGVTRTDAVLTAERVVAAPGERPSLRGPLPVAWESMPPAVLLDYVAPTRADEPGVVTLGISPDGSYVVDGLVEAGLTAPPADELFGIEVAVHDVVAAFFVPGEGSRDSARLVLQAARVDSVNRSNGRSSRKPEQSVEPEPVAG